MINYLTEKKSELTYQSEHERFHQVERAFRLSKSIFDCK